MAVTDAIMGRLFHGAYKFKLDGESMRNARRSRSAIPIRVKTTIRASLRSDQVAALPWFEWQRSARTSGSFHWFTHITLGQNVATEVPIDQDSVAWHTLMQASLEAMDEGFTVFDLNLRLLAWNKRLLYLYDLPESFVLVGTRFEDFMRFKAQRGEYGPGDIDELVAERTKLARQFLPYAFERTGLDGRAFEIRGNPIPGIGFVTAYNDVTERPPDIAHI